MREKVANQPMVGRWERALIVHTSVDFNSSVEQSIFMRPKEFKRFLSKQGCTFKNHKGGSGHLTVKRGDRSSQLPMHGRKELGTGLVNKILKDLGLK